MFYLDKKLSLKNSLMKVNIGSSDKLARLGIALALIILFYFEIVTGTLGLIAIILAFVLAITSLVNFCPIYAILGINTSKKKEKK